MKYLMLKLAITGKGGYFVGVGRFRILGGGRGGGRGAKFPEGT